MNFVETVVQQGQNVLNSMKDLKKAAKVKGEKGEPSLNALLQINIRSMSIHTPTKL